MIATTTNNSISVKARPARLGSPAQFHAHVPPEFDFSSSITLAAWFVCQPYMRKSAGKSADGADRLGGVSPPGQGRSKVRALEAKRGIAFSVASPSEREHAPQNRPAKSCGNLKPIWRSALRLKSGSGRLAAIGLHFLIAN